MNGTVQNEATVGIKYDEKSKVFDVLFNKPVPVSKKSTFTLIQYVHGENTFRGYDGEYKGKQEVVFKMSNSKECMTKTSTIQGQFAAIIYG